MTTIAFVKINMGQRKTSKKIQKCQKHPNPETSKKHPKSGNFQKTSKSWKCGQIYKNLKKSQKISKNRKKSHKCAKKCENAPRCATMRHDAPRCATMRHDAPRCATMRHDAPKNATVEIFFIYKILSSFFIILYIIYSGTSVAKRS
jgi:hypothetical protein